MFKLWNLTSHISFQDSLLPIHSQMHILHWPNTDQCHYLALSYCCMPWPFKLIPCFGTKAATSFTCATGMEGSRKPFLNRHFDKDIPVFVQFLPIVTISYFLFGLQQIHILFPKFIA